MVLILVLVLMLRTASSHCLQLGQSAWVQVLRFIFRKSATGALIFFIEGTSSYAAALQKIMRSQSRERKRKSDHARGRLKSLLVSSLELELALATSPARHLCIVYARQWPARRMSTFKRLPSSSYPPEPKTTSQEARSHRGLIRKDKHNSPCKLPCGGV
jgi:hypothetical protein